MNVEIELNNTLNKSQIEFDYVIQKDKIIIAYLISSQWKQKNMTMLNVWTHQNNFIVWLFNPCSVTQGRWDSIVNHEKAYFKAYWSFHIKCLKT